MTIPSISDKLVMQFDPRTIEHLGISLYSKLPTVLAELIANSWDADADNIQINFIDNGTDKSIYYEDDGDGMTFDELNANFLVIGRNRRLSTSQTTKKGRKVIGKKGLGKLSIFGICQVAEIITVKDGQKNHFEMDLEKIKANVGGIYEPLIHLKNQSVSERNGTKIILKNMNRNSPFDTSKIAESLSKKFSIFDAINVELKHNEDEPVRVTNELKFNGIAKRFTWDFPDASFDFDYPFSQQISGTIFTSEKPLKDPELTGVYLISRGKIVNTADFYGLRDTDYFHTYVSGYLAIDFIDDIERDLISTDRLSLNWEDDETRKLQDFLQKTIRKIYNEWRKKTAESKVESIKETSGVDVDGWKNALPKYEKELGEKIINPILEDPAIDVDLSSNLVKSVIEKFDNKEYKQYASDVAEMAKPEDIPKFIKLMDEWEIIENRQFSDLARTRIEVIRTFDKLITNDTKEVPELHNFLKKFSWLLDPRILEFEDEVKYSELLKKTFPDEKLDEKDRRIDFLCSNALGNILYVIEIKRSLYTVDLKALEQAYDYQAFLVEKFASQTGFSKVVCYIIGGEKSSDYKFRSKEQTYIKTGEVFVKTYTELLEQAKQFHKEFIEKDKEINGHLALKKSEAMARPVMVEKVAAEIDEKE